MPILANWLLRFNCFYFVHILICLCQSVVTERKRILNWKNAIVWRQHFSTLYIWMIWVQKMQKIELGGEVCECINI